MDNITKYRIARELHFAEKEVKWEEDTWGCLHSTMENYSLGVTWDFGIYYYFVACNKKKISDGDAQSETEAKEAAIKAYVNHSLNIKP